MTKDENKPLRQLVRPDHDNVVQSDSTEFSEADLARIDYIQEQLSEVLPRTRDQWIDIFTFEVFGLGRQPYENFLSWENVAMSYEEAQSQGDTTFDQRPVMFVMFMDFMSLLAGKCDPKDHERDALITIYETVVAELSEG